VKRPKANLPYARKEEVKGIVTRAFGEQSPVCTRRRERRCIISALYCAASPPPSGGGAI